jgi:hypothetical protein
MLCYASLACGEGQLAMARWLQRAGADLRATSADGYTSFYTALSVGELVIAKWLRAEA